MTDSIDHTHDSSVQSWVEFSQTAESDFPIQNLPWCVFSPPGGGQGRVGVGIGDQVLDMRRVAEAGCLSMGPAGALGRHESDALQADDLGGILRLNAQARLQLRHRIFELLRSDCGVLRDDPELRRQSLWAISQVELRLPCPIGDYTDFYASIFHATNVGSMFRPESPLFPNYAWLPVAYHGRSSSIVPSGTPIRRPVGQAAPSVQGTPPGFRASNQLDYELELGIWIAGQNRLGEVISIDAAEDRFFGVSLLNDWSARDVQRWEYQPLGPFLAKNFATTISPWIVTREALAPFRCPALDRRELGPGPLPHLNHPADQQRGGLALTLEVYLQSAKMRDSGIAPHRLSRGTFRDMYWTVAQMITHHTSNGCNLRPGDLLGSGTISGRDRATRGCLLELTWDGEYGTPQPGTARSPVKLPDGEDRLFLADGDEVALRGYAEAAGFHRIGLGSCLGRIEAAMSTRTERGNAS